MTFDETRIFQEERETLKYLDITLEEKSAKENILYWVFSTHKEKSAQTAWQKQYKYRMPVLIWDRYLKIAEIHLCALPKSSSAQVWEATIVHVVPESTFKALKYKV